ncbi:hypothetical protein FRC04_000457 [Tulasnella sp. 424]|nr:hypothetical protein FRC04_000457 [Tulasnella sp. 424]
MKQSASQSTLPSRPVNVIVIDDDDDVQEVQPPSSETSDESDWDLYHAGFVWPTLPSSIINAPKPSEPDLNEIDHTLLRLQRLRLATDEAPVGCEVMHSSSISECNSWSQTRRIKLSTRRVVTSNWDGADARLQLITTPGLLAAPGSVCKIDQSGPAVAFASSAIGGGSGAWDADQRSANRAGALLYWQQSDPSNILIPQQRTGDEWSVWEDPECHFRDNQAVRYRLHNREQEATVRVYYTVTDVKFNPLRPDVFVSSSFDKSIRTWQYDENQKRVRNTLDGYSHDYSATPQLLDFRPDSQILAVGCSDGSSYIHAPGIEYPQRLPLSSKQRLEVTAQSWGPESTISSDYLICGGGAPSQDKATPNRGWASAWILRPDKAERVCNFIMGDTAGFYCNHLCVNPTGQYVAIASADDELRFSAKNLVEFFDLRAKPRAIFRQYLPPSSGEDSGVLCSAFSPDGLYYACSREDNTAQVWDWRWMARNTKPLRMIEHQPPGRSSPRHAWGVPAMTWVAHDGASSPPLLVTGGDDGKIIQWDMRRSDSCLLAELESGVGSFSIGDRQNGEMPLIA